MIEGPPAPPGGRGGMASGDGEWSRMIQREDKDHLLLVLWQKAFQDVYNRDRIFRLVCPNHISAPASWSQRLRYRLELVGQWVGEQICKIGICCRRSHDED